MKLITITLLSILTLTSYAYAWNDEKTHPTLSAKAAAYFFGDSFIKQSLSGRTVKDWIEDGAKFEDAGTKWQFVNGTARSLNHFHVPTITNPTKNTLERI